MAGSNLKAWNFPIIKKLGVFALFLPLLLGIVSSLLYQYNIILSIGIKIVSIRKGDAPKSLIQNTRL